MNPIGTRIAYANAKAAAIHTSYEHNRAAIELDKLKKENEILKEENERLKKENEELRKG